MAAPINSLQDAEQRILALEKALADVKKQAFPLLLHQKGPLPGYMRAVAFNDPNLKGSMWANYSNIGPGSGPYSAVTDTAGVIRAEWGNLAAVGNSPAQYGFRANDATGTPIFDSLGLIAVMKVLGTVTDGNPTNVTSTTFITENSTSTTFSLARQATILALCHSSAFINAGTGNANGILNFDGTNHGPLGWWDSGNGIKQVTLSHFITLSAGSHTVDFRVKCDTGVTWANLQSALTVYLLGG